MKRLFKLFYEYWIKPYEPNEKDTSDNTGNMDGDSPSCCKK